MPENGELVPENGETATGGADRAVENQWFLARGLPMVLSRADRAQRLLVRSAPLVVAVAAVGVITLLGLLLPDTTDTEYSESTIDPFVIALYAGFVVTVIVVPPTAAWLVHRLIARSRPVVGRVLTVAIIIAVVFVIPFLQDDVVPGAHFLTDAALNLVLVAVTIWLTYLGAGSILTWAATSAVRQVTAVGTLVARALPLVVLIILVFFTGELWQLSARIPRARLWQTIAFLLSISAVFLVATLRDEVRAIREQRGAAERPLSRPEMANVLIVMLLAQFLQIAVFAVVIFSFFLGLGLIALPPEVIEMWTGSPSEQGTWFGVRVPVSQALIHVSMLVAAVSTMYFTVSSSTDPQYRERFFDPLVEDMADTLAARDRYLERWYPRP